jgi:PKHD-type hydroxylase
MHKRLWDVLLSPDAFSADDCKLILDTMVNVKLEPALVRGQTEPTKDRQSNVTFIAYDPEVWIFQKLGQVVSTINPQTFKFDLNPWFDEGFQFTQYPEGGYYNWHTDIGDGPTEYRKLSVVLQLNDDYEGGELEYFPARFGVPKQRGLVTLFPAYMPHRVRPVTKGTRYSLVTWVSGPTPFV